MNAPDRTAPSSHAVALAAFGLILAVFIFHACYYRFLCDDAFIYFRYAKNLLHGLGPVFNPGERVEGFASVVWLAVLTGLAALGVPMEISSVAVGMACGLAVLFLTHRLGRTLFPGRGWADYLIAPALLAVNRTFAAWSTGGLETSLFTFLVLLSFYRLLRETRESCFPLSGLLFSLVILARPEGVLFFGWALLLRLVLSRHRRLPAPATGRWGFWLDSAVVPAAGYLLFRILYYGHPFPNTFYAKVSGVWWDMGSRYLYSFFLEYGLFMVLLPAFAVFLPGGPPTRRRWCLAIFALTASWLLYVAMVGGDIFEYRFLHVVLPFVFLLVQEGLGALADRMRQARMRFWALGTGAALVLAVTLAFPLAANDHVPLGFMERESGVWGRIADARPFSPWLSAYMENYKRLKLHWVAERVELHRWMCESLMNSAKLLNRALTQGFLRRDERFAMISIGVIPYYTGVYTLDIHGLTDEGVAHQKVGSRNHIAHEKKATDEYLAARDIDYIGITPWIAVEKGDYPFIDPDDRRAGFFVVEFKEFYLIFRSLAPKEDVARKFADRGGRVFQVIGEAATRVDPPANSN